MKLRRLAARPAARRAGRCRSISTANMRSSRTSTFPPTGSSAPPPDLTTRMLRHERLIVGASIAFLVALSWAYLMRRAGMPDTMATMSPPLPALITMWWLMMVAMMLPSAAPAILLYARVRQQNARKAVAATWVFVGGYLSMW